MDLNELRDAVHATSVEKGWWSRAGARRAGYPGQWADTDPTFLEAMALVHAEASEAVEDYRAGLPVAEPRWKYTWEGPRPDLKFEGEKTYTHRVVGLGLVEVTPEWAAANGAKVKPEGIPQELADIIIRVLDISGAWGVDIAAAVASKMEYNAGRTFRHGGKLA